MNPPAMTKETAIITTLMRSWGLAIALVAISAALAIAHPGFLTVPNLLNVARQISINGILAVGVTLVLLTGGVDLSLGSVVALAGVVAASMAHPDQYPLLVPIGLGVAAGALCGATNGLLVTRGRVPSFIATLGMMTAARGLALVVANGRPVSNLSQDFTWLGGDVGRVPIPALVLVGLALGTSVDAIAAALQAVKDGRLDATVFQDARGQGGTAVELAVKIARQEPYEKETYIPFKLITKDNAGEVR